MKIHLRNSKAIQVLGRKEESQNWSRRNIKHRSKRNRIECEYLKKNKKKL